ncbi:MAG TPA: MBL fold metallo-hydrolase [Patescibacteria group bacterium]
MLIKFLGAAGTVTGSSYVLTSGAGSSIIIDLGMFQGTPEVEKLNYEPFDYDVRNLSGMVLTHAHLDHCGRLPILLSKGFKESIWMTPATRDLTQLSLLDSAKIAKNGDHEVLYDENLALKAISKFKTFNYHAPITIGDFTINAIDAGHILGSASLEIEDKHPNSQIRKIVFSGDLGNSPEPLEKETELVSTSDAVVLESTYGDRLHPHLNPSDAIQSEINSIEKSGGTLLIPAFSLERTQELLHMIMHLKEEKKVAPTTPIYMDSPMAKKATVFYLDYKELLNSHIQADLQKRNPFEFTGLKVIQSPQESESLHKQPGPKVIIAGSGMMVGGRILNHAAYYLPLASTRLLIVGFQGEGTLGRQLFEGSKKIVIEGQKVNVMATVSDTQAMSSHADQKQLLGWLSHIKNVKKVFLTHGEDVSRTALSKKISQELRIEDVALPKLNQEIEI